MKFDFKGIRFNVWKYFFIFSLSILLLLGFLQLVLIKPYYRDNRLETMKTMVSTMEENLIVNKANQKAVEETFDLIINNNTCVAIYNEQGQRLYQNDALGAACMLHQEIELFDQPIHIDAERKAMVDLLKERKVVDTTIVSSVTGHEMLLYGKQIQDHLTNYYLVLNSPLEPVESIVDFILQQYLFIAIIVFVIAFGVSFILANRIGSPIVKMKKAANQLAKGHYDVDFKVQKGSFSEIDDLADTLDDATEQLSRIDELRKDLIANVSHDIKTPLTMIQAYAEMIEDISGDDPLKRKEHLGVILKETEYLNRLVTDMQELSKVQAGYMTLQRENFDLGKCIENVLELLKELFLEHHLILKKELCEVIVYGDEMKISQVIYNYVTNAIKHSKEGDTITVTMKDEEYRVRVEVMDEGEGIKEEDLPYIWDRYYKIDKGFSRNMESTGLGLAIVKAILEAHHASFGVQSKLGEGSNFYFELSKEYEEEDEGLS